MSQLHCRASSYTVQLSSGRNAQTLFGDQFGSGMFPQHVGTSAPRGLLSCAPRNRDMFLIHGHLLVEARISLALQNFPNFVVMDLPSQKRFG